MSTGFEVLWDNPVLGSVYGSIWMNTSLKLI